MACDLTRGRSLECKDKIGGLEAVYFMNEDEFEYSDLTLDATDAITAIAGSQRAFHYDLKNDACTFTTNIASDRQTGTTVFEQVLELTLPNLTVEDHKELKLLAYANPKIMVRDNNDNFFLMGVRFGADCTGGTAVTGGAMTDLSGYTLSFTAKEREMPFFFNDTTEANLASNCGFVFIKGGSVFVS